MIKALTFYTVAYIYILINVKRILGINSGQIVFDDRPCELTKETIYEIYGAESGDLITELESIT